MTEKPLPRVAGSTIALTLAILLSLINPEANGQSNITQDGQATKTNDPMATALSILTLIVGSGGVATLFWGIKQYKDSKVLKRQETLLELTKKFADSNEMKLAKGLLDGFYGFEIDIWQEHQKEFFENYTYYEGLAWNGDRFHYHRTSFMEILRYHPDTLSVDDQGDKLIRNSFDSLLDFLGYVGYLTDIGIITRKEVQYFAFYVKKMLNDVWALGYARCYEFNMFPPLVRKMDLLPQKPNRAEGEREHDYEQRLKDWKWLKGEDVEPCTAIASN